MIDWEKLTEQLSSKLSFKVYPKPQPVSGGSISATWRVSSDSGFIFVKTDAKHFLEAEMKGLVLLGKSNTVRVPKVLAFDTIGGQSYLATEWLDFVPNNKESESLLGGYLAQLHRCEHDHFGLCHNNFIGRTPQENIWTASWPEFYRDYRLQPQFSLATENRFNGVLLKLGSRLCERIDDFFDHEPVQVSLLHGDLWGGNWGTIFNGEPVIYDPAVYWGHREADLAMTELFGGFSDVFYRAYQEAWPTSELYPIRRDLYNLYHVLNHLNLFGGAYYSNAVGLINRLLKAI